MATYTEQVLRFRVMRQMNDAKRNPNGNWSLIFSTMEYEHAEEEMIEQIKVWARLGDAFKIVDGGGVTTIEREAYF